MPKLVLGISIYMQPTTTAEDIFKCIFFVAGEGSKFQQEILLNNIKRKLNMNFVNIGLHVVLSLLMPGAGYLSALKR